MSVRRFKIFTLIELLVVVAVIAILAALLLPALNKAREKSRTIKCVSNTKQIGTYLALYVDDNTGYFPHAMVFNSAGTSSNLWNDVLMVSYAGAVVESKKIADEVWEKSIFKCPSMNAKITGNSFIHYGYNYWHLGAKRHAHELDPNCYPGGTYNVPCRAGVIRNPSGMVAAADSWHNGTGNGSYYVQDKWMASNPVIDTRHDGKNYNIVWADGHAGTQVGDGIPKNVYEPAQLYRYNGTPNKWTRSGLSYKLDH